MNFKNICIPLLLAAGCIAFISGKPIDKIIKPGSVPEKLAGGFSFTEGPAADSKGNVFFTDQPNDRIMEWSISDKLSTFMQPSGRSNGMSFDKLGNLWTCADEKNEIWCISPERKVIIIPSKYKNKPLNGPNDLWIADNGGIYFTDPFYKRAWWDHDAMPQSCQGVYYLSPDHKSITLVANDLIKPNGIVGTANSKTLFVADLGANKTWKYTIGADGSLGNKMLFCEKGSDGMTIDTKGNIYLTGNGVTIYNKKGILLGNIAVPEGWTANVCFGGSDMKSLFITASESIYRIHTLVKGFN